MIDHIRARIDEVDRQLADLVAERMTLSAQLGIEKSKRGLPITDRARERAVRHRWEELFAQRGLSLALADQFVEALLKESKRVQVRAEAPADVLIIGEGRMGTLLQRCFADAGHNAIKASAEKAVGTYAGQKFVVLAVPPGAEVELGFAKGSVVMDIASSKAKVFPKLEEESQRVGFSYVSTHPLFGAVEYPFDERVVIIPSKTSGNALAQVINLWESAGFSVIVSSVEEHERAMSAVQVMVHAHLSSLALALSEFKRETGLDPYDFQTRTLRRLRPVLEDFSRNQRVVAEIREQNPYAKEALSASLEAFKKVAGEEPREESRGEPA
ncbi:prephenate dehydrogenase/arogenate dehydrogenase family protein [Tardisphaera miroshnichenkoae]